MVRVHRSRRTVAQAGAAKRIAGGPIAALLCHDVGPTPAEGATLLLWLRRHAAIQRMIVWVAVGILIQYADVTSVNALAVLRAHAFQPRGHAR